MGCRLLVALCVSLPILAKASGLLVLGDSISAAYGIEKEQGWVALLEAQLEQQCPGFPVINASVSGETSAGGRNRLPALLSEHQPDIVVIELGGNDGLRGLSPMAMAKNLQRMVEDSKMSSAVPVLLGMRIPPNYGEQYTRLFERQFSLVAEQTGVALMPFFLDGVVEAGYMQADGIHPDARAQPLLKHNALSVLDRVLAPHCQPEEH